ncbi:hypothetical protein C2S53_008457 [Perilla frutescens var. hirtella]|uniref:Glycosyltransferase N-terminal domain-containing protein n=1 Tax=Perilla frutescens var. hirtella TaxID=608512 RepID=A0AAD4IUK9_PERFH|nr:hypothetical protein C2S53_008457 [Perilla frutescens var. hirtella]
MEQAEVAVIAVPLAAQGHLNQMMHLSCLIASYGLPVFFVGSALHNRQAKARINGLSPQQLLNIQFHDIITPPFASPAPDPNSPNKFPAQLHPAWAAMLNLRHPVAAYLRDMATKFRRVVVVHDSMMAFVVQDVASIPNSESYAFNTSSAFTQVYFIWNSLGKPFPVEHPKELLPFEGIIPDEVAHSFSVHLEPLSYRAGDIYNICRSIEAPYMEVLEREEVRGNRKIWATGPMLPTLSSSASNQTEREHKCFQWLDKQEQKSVIYVSFGTTVSLSDEQINELAHGLERSKVKFLWVLRDADKDSTRPEMGMREFRNLVGDKEALDHRPEMGMREFQNSVGDKEA